MLLPTIAYLRGSGGSNKKVTEINNSHTMTSVVHEISFVAEIYKTIYYPPQRIQGQEIFSASFDNKTCNYDTEYYIYTYIYIYIYIFVYT